jgi:hypothetical protein
MAYVAHGRVCFSAARGSVSGAGLRADSYLDIVPRQWWSLGRFRTGQKRRVVGAFAANIAYFADGDYRGGELDGGRTAGHIVCSASVPAHLEPHRLMTPNDIIA